MLLFTWIGIVLCLSQSAMMSGLNLAFFSMSKLRLEMEASKNNRHAVRVLALRKDSNFLLVTILWTNVAANVLLSLLSGSILIGVVAFFFSTVVITIVGEIIPQAYFSRHALKTASFFSPVIRFYQILFYIVAKPTALVLDQWLGKEAITYYKEKDLQTLIEIHMAYQETDIAKIEGKGAINFLDLDDILLSDEGEIVCPESIFTLEFISSKPVFPEISPTPEDDFLVKISKSKKKWIILKDLQGEPRMVLNADEFVRSALFESNRFNPYWHCHRPIIVKDAQATLGQVIPHLKVINSEHREDDVIDEDIILHWGKEKKVITGSDILGRLLRGIVQNKAVLLKDDSETQEVGNLVLISKGLKNKK
jgi:metal transporter CNNM